MFFEVKLAILSPFMSSPYVSQTKKEFKIAFDKITAVVHILSPSLTNVSK